MSKSPLPDGLEITMEVKGTENFFKDGSYSIDYEVSLDIQNSNINSEIPLNSSVKESGQ